MNATDSTESSTVAWVAADWGTSNLRVWALDPQGSVIDSANSERGMSKLQTTEFEAALLELVAPWLHDNKPMPVIACVMVGARQGWVEAPYVAVPCQPLAAQHMMRAPVKDHRLSVHIVPGLCQRQPADVMRGEETQIAGFLSSNSRYDGVLCLPGTHSKWVQVRNGEVIGFNTIMSGELYALLTTQSVLCHSVGRDDQAWDAVSFASHVQRSIAAPEALTGMLFTLRAESLLNNLQPAAARSALSGLLIGQELRATHALWSEKRIALVGGDALIEHYASAFATQSVTVETHRGADLSLLGLTAAYAELQGTR